MSSIEINVDTVPGAIALDYPCWQCTGNDIPHCTICNGTGYQLLPDGEKLLEFFKRHMKAASVDVKW